MAEGTIKRITEKGFGFIDDGSGKDVFFHSSGVEGGGFDQLMEGQRVSYDVGSGPKGPARKTSERSSREYLILFWKSLRASIGCNSVRCSFCVEWQ